MEDDNYVDSSAIDETSMQQAGMEDAEDMQEYQQENYEDASFGGVPEAKPRDSIYTFFNKILDMKDSTKVGNINPKGELGRLPQSVRSSQYISLVGEMMHNKAIYEFFRAQGEILLSTSMSKNGWLPELVVSQKKYTTRAVQQVASQQQQQQKKGLLWNRSPQQQPQGGQ